MNYLLLADLTAVVHALILLAVVIGLLISFRYKRFRPWEAGSLLLIVVLWSYYGNCPLTILEEHYRVLGGQPSGITDIGFLPYYANEIFGLTIPSKVVQRTTFFMGGVVFMGSIEALAPIMHMEIFKLRRTLSRFFGRKTKKR